MSASVLDRPVRLAVYFDQKLRSGGGYQQEINAALLAKRLPGDLCQTYFFTPVKENVHLLKEYGIAAHFVRFWPWSRLLGNVRKHVRDASLLKTMQLVFGPSAIEKAFSPFGIDLVYFLGPASHIRNVERLNFIATVWDLCHRDDPEFPEVRSDRVFESREEYYRSTLPKAVAVLADSATGRDNIIRRYGVDEERIHIMPFSPAYATSRHADASVAHEFDVKREYGISGEYLFYPAQFWPHKNHVYILEAMHLLEKKFGRRISAVFSGGDNGSNLAYVKQVCRELGLDDRVRFVGFVDNEKMPALYLQSLALAMPTYFGPTNLPPLEAWSLGVPVIYPGKRGLKEQAGDSALLVDLNDPSTLAAAIMDLLDDGELRSRLSLLGMQRMREASDDDRLNVLTDILRKFRSRRKCWL